MAILKPFKGIRPIASAVARIASKPYDVLNEKEARSECAGNNDSFYHVIKPEIDELKEKYGEDPTKMQQEQMKLFSQLGVSPISGCLPLLLQMPFLLIHRL